MEKKLIFQDLTLMTLKNKNAHIGFLCQSLVRKGYLTFAKGHYSLAKEGIRTLLSQEGPKIDPTPARRSGVDRELLKEVIDEVAREISNELKKTVEEIKLPKEKINPAPSERCGIKIMTDFVFPIEDESLALESNIYKMGPNLEKEKFDIDESVKLFKKFKREEGRDD